MRFIFLGLVALMFSCTWFGDKNAELITGRWELSQAFRNERPTESLDNLYMEFLSSGQLKTNLMGTDEVFEYQYLKGEIIQNSSNFEPLIYKIEAISDSNLILTTSLKNFKFRFVMTKSS